MINPVKPIVKIAPEIFVFRSQITQICPLIDEVPPQWPLSKQPKNNGKKSKNVPFRYLTTNSNVQNSPPPSQTAKNSNPSSKKTYQSNKSVFPPLFACDCLRTGILHVVGRCKDIQGEWPVVAATDVGGGK
jgi:hypothetical protein